LPQDVSEIDGGLGQKPDDQELEGKQVDKSKPGVLGTFHRKRMICMVNDTPYLPIVVDFNLKGHLLP